MAIGIHVVRTRFVGVNAAGQVIDKGLSSTSIKDVMQSEHQHRVIADSAVPNSATQPTVDAYLALEAASNYVLHYMDQNMIVTYNQTQINAA